MEAVLAEIRAGEDRDERLAAFVRRLTTDIAALPTTPILARGVVQKLAIALQVR